MLFGLKKCLTLLKTENYVDMLLLIYRNHSKKKTLKHLIILHCSKNVITKTTELLIGFITPMFQQSNFNSVILKLLKIYEICLLNTTLLPMSFISFNFMVILVTCIKNWISLLMKIS